MKRKSLLFFFILLGLVSLPLLAAEPDKNTAPAQDQYAKLAEQYVAATTDAQKLVILQKILKANTADGHAVFYKILRTADESDISVFASAIKSDGTTELLLGFTPYIKKIQAFYKAEAAKNPNMTRAEMAELQKRANDTLKPIETKINKLHPAFAVIAKKDTKPLIAAVEKVFIDPDGEIVDATGGLLGLFSMGEEGATALLKAIDGNGKSKGALTIAANMFGPAIVIPALKQYEDPVSTKSQKSAAMLVVFMVPDAESVYDKFVEAYRHGRYFPLVAKKDKDGKIVIDSLEVAVEMASSWWGNYIKSKYKDNDKFVDYVAKKYLADPASQEEVIELLAHTNFKAAAPHLAALEISKLSAKSLTTLIQVSHVSGTSASLPPALKEFAKDECIAEKYSIFCRIFLALDAKAREKEKLIYGLMGYPAEFKEAFIKDVFKTLTEEEKKTVVYLCGKKEDGMPEATRTKILDAMRVGASDELKRVIDYMAKEK